MKVKDLAAAVGLKPSACGAEIKKLIEDGAVVATGQTMARRVALPGTKVPKEVP